MDDSSNKAAKRARKGRTRHKMGGARLDMSAPDIRDKVEIVETIGEETKSVIEWEVRFEERIDWPRLKMR